VNREPIILNISKEDTKNKVTIDLRPYNLIVDGDILVMLEYVKDFKDPRREPEIYFVADNGGMSYFRHSLSQWITTRYTPCISIDAQVELKHKPSQKRIEQMIKQAIDDSVKIEKFESPQINKWFRETRESTFIEQPKIGGTNVSFLNIGNIELTDSATIINFELDYIPDTPINIPANTYIQNSMGGDTLYVSGAKGIEIGVPLKTNSDGKLRYSLYFPPLDVSVNKIDYVEKNGWEMYEIDLVKSKGMSFIPEKFQGSWYDDKACVLVFYDDVVIYKNEVYNDNYLLYKKQKYQSGMNIGKKNIVELRKGRFRKSLFIKETKDAITMGDTYKQFRYLNNPSYTKNKQILPKTTIDSSLFSLPIFKPDTAIYKGYIRGYHPKLGFTTGAISLRNIFSNESQTIIINIKPDGTFKAKVPLLYPRQVYIEPNRVFDRVYLEPGKTTFHVIDLTPIFGIIPKGKTPDILEVFMGETAPINNALRAMESIDYFNYEYVINNIANQSPAEYKSDCLEILKKEQDSLEIFTRKNAICGKARQLKEMQIKFKAYENVLSYEMLLKRVGKEYKGDLSATGYFNNMDFSDLNNPVSLIAASEYNFLLNRMDYSHGVRVQPSFNYIYKVLSDSLHVKAINLSSEESGLLDKLKTCESIDRLKMIVKQDSSTFIEFEAKYRDLLNSIRENANWLYHDEKLKEYFGLENGLAKEIMFAQTMCGRMNGAYKPFSENDIMQINQTIHTEFLVDYLKQLSKAKEDEIAQKLEANKNKTGFHVNETPKTEGDKLFDKIIQKYKGKVIFVDFWATWCGPCREGIEKMKPLKEEIKNKDVVFLYITDESSPVETWELMIPDIKGEHYRLKRDEWNYIKSKFKINGIPHYALVNKTGETVRDHIYFSSSNDEFRKLINECLK
jgi:thiol-disulfide isomerase/thioredoxin